MKEQYTLLYLKTSDQIRHTWAWGVGTSRLTPNLSGSTPNLKSAAYTLGTPFRLGQPTPLPTPTPLQKM